MAVTINGSTGIAGVDGSAGTPAVQGADANTGIFFPAADTIAFAEGGAEVMRINSSGNVGIGTSLPTGRLNVDGGAGNSKLKLSNTASGNTGSDGFDLDFTGTDIYITNRESGFMAFENNGAERMRIDSSGNLLVGTTSAYGSRFQVTRSGGTPAAIHNSGGTSGSFNQILFLNNAGTADIGYIARTNDTSVSYNTTSDYRLKEAVQPMTGALARVAALKPVTYKWKADGSDGQGFIAHELQAVVPDCVSGEKDAVDADGKPVYQGIDTSFLVATLTAAIQEQQALIAALQADVAALKGAQA
jgi:hypothetical protein